MKSEESSSVMLDVCGDAAPPRINGELVFEAPWEGRAFGLVMALCERSVIEWEQFRVQLITAIGGWESAPDPKPPWSYYACWLVAAECALTDAGVLQTAEIERLFQTFSERPHGHDHHH